MKTCFLVIGKTTEDYLKEGIAIYEKRLKNYLSFEIKVLPEIKKTSGLSFEQQKSLEGKMILESINPSDFVILLDERGKELSSTDFANFLQKQMLQRIKSMIFVVGGPYGFSKEIYNRANEKISLSKMTYSHQMVRLIFAEQLYRAMTILKNEPYHH
ncbi:MAG TPA: 23S rRNA (pseudouridine(1915)-N(3))-methyltransferase RlmH [Bacteroidales bacterium]